MILSKRHKEPHWFGWVNWYNSGAVREAMERGGKKMTPKVFATVSLTRDELVHLYSGGALNLRIKGKEAEASVELSCPDAPPKRGTRIRFKIITAE